MKKNIRNNLIVVASFILSFLLIDFGLRNLTFSIAKFKGLAYLPPFFFDLSIISFLLLIFYLCPKIMRHFFYITILIFTYLIFIAEKIYMDFFGKPLTFSDIFSVNEGVIYFNTIFAKFNFSMFIPIILSLICMIIVIKLTNESFLKIRLIKDYKYIVLLLGVTTIFRILAIRQLGHLLPNDDPLSFNNPRNLYHDYNLGYKNIQISGLYEYIPRTIYVYIRDNCLINSQKNITIIDNYIASNNKKWEINKYTGLFTDKNLIVILMESVDNWLITEANTPNLYYLREHSLNFTNRYSPNFGEGETLNSDFAINTSLYGIDNDKAVYNYANNSFPYSLANLFKKQGYQTTAIHMNHGWFYNREKLYQAFNYHNSYFALDMDIDKSYNYQLDTSMLKNDEIAKYFITDNKFLTYFISYSAHLPYVDTNTFCNAKKITTATDCIHYLVNDTDQAVGLLLQQLKENNLYDNTVIVFITDHYTYGFDNDYIAHIKGVTTRNLLQHTPFFIWSNDLNGTNIDTYVDTADILPTLLNMFNIPYNPNYYNGEDIFSSYHQNYIYFSDYSYFDGIYHHSDINNSIEELKLYQAIKTKIDINNRIIRSDYYKERMMLK